MSDSSASSSSLQATPVTVWQMAENGDVEKLLAWINSGGDVDAKDEANQATPLYYAAAQDQDECVRVLLAAKASVSIRNRLSCPPLIAATQNNNTKIIKQLLDAKADVNHGTYYNWVALHSAAKCGSIDTGTLQMLLDANATLDVVEGLNGYTPLHCAILNGNVAKVQVLLNAKANIAATTHHRENSLHLAASQARGSGSLAQLLIDAKSLTSLHAKNSRDQTPLHAAAKYGNEAVTNVLINAKANVNSTTDQDLQTPLHNAAKNGDYATVQALVEAGARLEARNRWAKTPLHLAAEFGESSLSVLLVAKADIHVKDSSNRTPLHLAAQKGITYAIRQLLYAKADADVPDISGKTPLHLAAEMGHSEVVKTFIFATNSNLSQ